MEEKPKTIVLELTEAEARVLEGAAIAAYHEWSYSGTDGLHLWSGITKLDEALQSNHQRVVVDIIPIEEMPEEWKECAFNMSGFEWGAAATEEEDDGA